MAVYYIIIPLVFFFISLYLAKKDFLLVVGFILCLNIFLGIFLHKTIPTIGFAAGTFINITIILIFIYYVFTNPKILKSKYTYIYIGSIFITLTYLILLALTRHHEYQSYLHFIRNFFFNFLLLILFLNISGKNEKNIHFYINFIIFIFTLQILIGFAQYFSPSISDFFKITEYQRFGEYLPRLDNILTSQKIVTGSLLGMANYALFIVVLIVFAFSLKVYKLNMINSKINLLLLLAAILIVIFTGIRAPIISLIIGISIILWFKNKLISVTFVILFFYTSIYLSEILNSQIIYATTANKGGAMVESPIQRLAGIFAIFDNTNIGYTTLRRTLDLFNEFLVNPIFGSGTGLIFSGYSFTDAFLLIINLEFGILFFILLMFPYIYTLRLMKKKCHPIISKIGWILLLTILSQSIVDQGLWSPYQNILFFFLIMILFRINLTIKPINYTNQALLPKQTRV